MKEMLSKDNQIMIKGKDTGESKQSILEVSLLIIQLAYPAFHFKPTGQQIKHKENGKEVHFELPHSHSVILFNVHFQQSVEHRRVWQILKPIGAIMN